MLTGVMVCGYEHGLVMCEAELLIERWAVDFGCVGALPIYVEGVDAASISPLPFARARLSIREMEMATSPAAAPLRMLK